MTELLSEIPICYSQAIKEFDRLWNHGARCEAEGKRMAELIDFINAIDLTPPCHAID